MAPRISSFFSFPLQTGFSLTQLPFQFFHSSPLQFPLGSSIFGPTLVQCLTPAYFIFSYPSLTPALFAFELGTLWQFVLALAIRAGFIQNVLLIPCYRSRDLIFTKKGKCDKNMGFWFGFFPSSAYVFLNFALQHERAHRKFQRPLPL